MAGHTTIRLNEALLRRAKAYARRQGTTLTAVMERAITAYLKQANQEAHAASVRLPSFGRGGVRPGVELDRTSALLDLMDDAGSNSGDRAE